MENSCVEGREVKCFNVIVWGIVVSKVEKAGPGGGIVGDLSVAECSVVDSEYVTEYCHNNMQVSMEKSEFFTAESSDNTDNLFLFS